MAEVEVESGAGRARRDGPDGPIELVGVAELFDDLIDRFDQLRRRPAVAAIMGVLMLLPVAGLWWLEGGSADTPIEELIPVVDPDLAAGADEADRSAADPTTVTSQPVSDVTVGVVVVHVVGAVVRPGLVELAADGRVADAIDAAGGATSDGDPHRLNLAAPVVDGLRIRVPRLGEDTADGGGDGGGGDPLLSLPSTEIGSAGSAGQGIDGPVAGPVDLNRADSDRLESLPGVGPVTAAAIVDWREEHGPFLAVDDLLSVPGIGPAKLEGLRDRVIV